MRADRLLRLATFLETKVPRAKFDFNVLASQGGKPMLEALALGEHICGTVGCALGWAPAAFPNELIWIDSGGTQLEIGIKGQDEDKFFSDSWEVAHEFFELTPREVDYLFMPGSSKLSGQASPQEVAANIRDFVTYGIPGGRWINEDE